MTKANGLFRRNSTRFINIRTLFPIYIKKIIKFSVSFITANIPLTIVVSVGTVGGIANLLPQEVATPLKPVSLPKLASLPELGSVFANDTVTVGALHLSNVNIPGSNYPNYGQEFKSYLERELKEQTGKDIRVVIESLPIQIKGNKDEALRKLELKKWDIAFLINPILTYEAIQLKYNQIAFNTFRDEPTFEVAIIAPKNSSINTIKEPLPQDASFVIGPRDSFGAYEVPLYMLYGQSLKLEQAPPRDIVSIVGNRQADLGAIWYSEGLRNNRAIEVLEVSKRYPAGGVLLSPALTPTAKKILRDALDNAPVNLKDDVAYLDLENEQDYTGIQSVDERVSEILRCLDEHGINTGASVQLFCRIADVRGKVNGYQQNGSEITLNLQGDPSDSQLIISINELRAGLNEASLDEINGRELVITNAEKVEARGRERFKFGYQSQIMFAR